MEELKIQTIIGSLTAIFITTHINCYQYIVTAYFKEKPSVIVEANSINDAINKLHNALIIILDYEKENII
jgi:hypothetical protein